MGRPVNLDQYRIDEIDDFDDVDDAEAVDDRQAKAWYVQVGAGDVRVLSREQLYDFYRLGVINEQTYVWQRGMQHWLPLATWVGQQPAPSTDDDWQVLMGPGDVRTLSLEQLDDFFRLGVIDEQTFVWQTGMQQWSQLSTLIGAQDDEELEAFWYVLMGPGEVRTLSLEQLDDFFRLDVINEQTLLWQPGMAQWLPLGTVAGIEPSAPKAVTSAVSAVTRSAPEYMVSAPPLALSIGAPELQRREGSWLLRIAIAAGLLLTLYRNDVLYSAAQQVKQQGKYAGVELRVLGGPQFGTSRSVDKLIAEGGGHIAPVRLPWIVTQMQQAASSQAASPSISPDPSAIAQPLKLPNVPASAANVDSVASATDTSTSNEPSASGQANDSKRSTSDMAAALTGQSAKPKITVVKPASVPRTTKKPSAHGTTVFRAKGDYYDPLNPSMRTDPND